MSVGVVLLAAGSSRRFGSKIPKQFAHLAGEPLYLKSLRIFARRRSVTEIVIVCRPTSMGRIHRSLPGLPGRVNLKLVSGGSFRGKSVQNGFRALSDKIQIVLVHDTARPLVDEGIIRRVEGATRRFGVALAGWPLPDTLKLANKKSVVLKTVPRENLWLAQTPQGFKRKIALACLNHPSPTATDDVELAQRRGYRVKLVKGSPINMKVTFTHDLSICRILNQG
jgi:2-C-methyl-D-erythritol 4-phosphate cytidylyltransferase